MLFLSPKTVKPSIGDVVLLLAARHMAERKRLTNHLVVTTLMANMGLERALRESGIEMVRTPVGDKYVLEGKCFSVTRPWAGSSRDTLFSGNTPRRVTGFSPLARYSKYCRQTTNH